MTPQSYSYPEARPPLPPGGAAHRGGSPRGAWLLPCLALWLCCLWAWPAAAGGLSLNLVETDTGRVILSRPVAAGEPFTLWFLHSYDRAFFAEHYRALGPSRILLVNMTFKSNLNGEGFEYHDFRLHPDGVGELANINEHRDEVHFMMGSPDMANHTLILRDRRIPLARYVAPGTLISLRVAEAAHTPDR